MLKTIFTVVFLYLSFSPVSYGDLLDISNSPEDTIQRLLNEPSDHLAPLDLRALVIPIIENFRGWTKLNLPDTSSSIWMPDLFYSSGFKAQHDPVKWINKIKQMKFCEPNPEWKNIPVFYNINSNMTNIFENSIHHPGSPSTINISYSKTAYLNGKRRNVSYSLSKFFENDSPQISVRCTAENEEGKTHIINQTFDISNPDNFRVEQKTVLGNGEVIRIYSRPEK